MNDIIVRLAKTTKSHVYINLQSHASCSCLPFSVSHGGLCLAVGLTDYEVRDLNDEINKLIREKGHWESQIVNLGGANYKRGVPKMLDDSGKEVPGTRGYK